MIASIAARQESRYGRLSIKRIVTPAASAERDAVRRDPA